MFAVHRDKLNGCYGASFSDDKLHATTPATTPTTTHSTMPPACTTTPTTTPAALPTVVIGRRDISLEAHSVEYGTWRYSPT